MDVEKMAKHEPRVRGQQRVQHDLATRLPSIPTPRAHTAAWAGTTLALLLAVACSESSPGVTSVADEGADPEDGEGTDEMLDPASDHDAPEEPGPIVADCQDGWCVIPARSFRMGVDASQTYYGGDWALPRHEVALTRSFAIQALEVTRGAWKVTMESDPSTKYPACGDTCPASNVSIFAMLEYANRLSRRDGYDECYALESCDEGYACARALFVGPDCTGYRLPSEAEWELAAGAGSETCYPNGEHQGAEGHCRDDEVASEIGWFCANSEVDYPGCGDCSTLGLPFDPPPATCCGLHPVGQKLPNPFGLYDTAGNVSEATGTLLKVGGSTPTLELDPGFDRVIDLTIVTRGGAYSETSIALCSFARGAFGPKVGTAGLVGFRLVRTLP